MDTSAENRDSRTNIYEVGYLLIPTISEEQLPGEVEKIKAVISKNNGTFISDEMPKLRNLAYTMRKSVGGGYNKYEKAYFGWVKFETEISSVPEIQKEINKNESILRSIIITTVRENTIFTKPVAPEIDVVTEDAPAELETEEVVADKAVENIVAE
jgi:ribosomal protein S6